MSGIPAWARVGAKVVCIDAGPSPFLGTVCQLVCGQVYEIEEIVDLNSVRLLPDLPDELRFGVHLRGVVSPVQKPCRVEGWRRPFLLCRFRPLVTKSLEDDISIFAPLLKTKEVADA